MGYLMRHFQHAPVILIIFVAALPALTVIAQDLPPPFHALTGRAREQANALVEDHTLKRSLLIEHPIVNRPLHQFLLDRPDVGAAIARSVGIGKYTMTQVEKDRFHGRDPDGVEGDMEILYRAEGQRVYFAQGIVEGALVTLQGKMIMFQESQYRSTEQAGQWVRTQLTIYAKIENPFIAFVLKIFAPLIGGLVDPKISKAQGVVRQVNELMAQDLEETYSRIATADQLDPEDLTTLRKLMGLPDPSANQG